MKEDRYNSLYFSEKKLKESGNEQWRDSIREEILWLYDKTPVMNEKKMLIEKARQYLDADFVQELQRKYVECFND